MKHIRSVILVGIALTACSSSADLGHLANTGGTPGGDTPSSGGAAASIPTNTGGSNSTGNACSAGGSGGTLPCDILEQACQPCVSAHSTVRVLRSAYSGPLYQVMRADGTSQDIGVVDGYADAASQDTFCSGSTCTVEIIYDQSGQHNDLTVAPPGGAKPTPGMPAGAADLKVTIHGHSAYGLLFKPNMGYRKLIGNGTAVGDEPETMYMVSCGTKDLVNGCCFDYGNAETDARDDGNGTAEAVYLGQGVAWGSGSGDPPWVMADLENGLFPGWEDHQSSNISTNTTVAYDFVTGVVVGDTADKNGGRGRFAIYGGDATSGTLKTMWDGIRPTRQGYVPMQKQGSIILSIAGDNSDGDGGRFYEGAMANGAATRATVDALQAAIVAARYGQ